MSDTHTTSEPKRILVTGGSGYVGSQVILQLLTAGHTVHTTVRSASREKELRDAIQSAGTDTKGQLCFFVADLMKDDGWAEAVKGCDYVHHVASPFPSAAPRDENDLIRPAREGTLRVLKFARDAGVKRAVITSSFASIGFGYKNDPVFTEDNWTILDGPVTVPAYHKSKTLAEKAAWDFIEKEGGSLELSVVNPTGIFGPVLTANLSSSVEVVKMMMQGKVPACPQLSFGIVDVRDVAKLHMLCMTHPDAKGQRFIAKNDNGPVSLIDMANIIRKNRPAFARKMPSRELPNFVVRVGSWFSPTFQTIVPELGVVKRINNSKAQKVLGWIPRSNEECVLDTTDSLAKRGIA